MIVLAKPVALASSFMSNVVGSSTKPIPHQAECVSPCLLPYGQ
jgi:hypothetical protein